MPTLTDDAALQFLNVLWYTVAQRIVERIIAVTDLDEERQAALRQAALRPMDFKVIRKRTDEESC
jgi:hypothetical protein